MHFEASRSLAWLSPFGPAALSLSLFLIGVGWSFNLIGASSLLTGALNPSERPRVQGFADFLSGIATVVASLAAGVLLAGIGFEAMGASGAALMALTLLMVGLAARRPASPA